MFGGLLTSFTGGMAIVLTALLLLVVYRLLAARRPIKEVMFLRPRDRRGKRMRVTRETDRSAFCERENPTHRFIKLGPAYEFQEGGRLVTRFFGVEGSAYTADLSGPNPNPLRLTLGEILSEYDWYRKLPQRIRDEVEKAKFGVVVDVKAIDPDEYGLPRWTSDDVHDEADAVILRRLAAGSQVSTVKREFYQLMVGIGLGMLAALLVLRWGVL